MVATNASLRVAPTEPAAALKSANGTDTASKRGVQRTPRHQRAERRRRGLDDPGDRAGRPSELFDRAERIAQQLAGGPQRGPTDPGTGLRLARDAVAERTGAGHRPQRRHDAVGAGAPTTRRASPRLVVGSASRSTIWARSCTMPRPSAIAWCTFITNAARSPGRPSMTHSSHSGRSLSNDRPASRCAWSSTSRRPTRRPGSRAQL